MLMPTAQTALCFWFAVQCLGGEAVAAAALPRAATSENFARAPYLQFATPNTMHVVWRTWGPIEASVRFGTNLDALTQTDVRQALVRRASLGTEGQAISPQWARFSTPENRRLPKLHTAPEGTFQYEACLSNLYPATLYFYAVYDGSSRLTPSEPTYCFRTPPEVGTQEPVRFAVIGDSGTGHAAQAEVFGALLKNVHESGRALDFWLHVGDMAYATGRDMEFQTRVFEPYELLMRNTVCWPTMGNHEGATSKGTTGIGPYFDAYVVPTRGEAGGLASGTEAYYSFDHANVHFICLDSHDLDRKPGGAMAKWLKADLEQAQAEWLIAFWHHPPYSKGSHDSDKDKDLTEMREYIMPIIESGGVDLVLTGHSHIYERTMLMDGAYATPTVSENIILDDGDGDPGGDGPYRKSAGVHAHQGTIEVVAGNGGQTLGRTGSSPVMKRIVVEHGSVIVDVNHGVLTARMVNYHGAIRDLFSIVKQGQIEPQRLALPWQPPAYVKAEAGPKTLSTPPVRHGVLIAPNAEWQYQLSEQVHGQGWTGNSFDASNWLTGRAGFGFGDSEFLTKLAPVRGQLISVYLRKNFQIKQADAVTEIGLMVNYSDGFIAYVNGHEVARVNIGRSSGRNVQNVTVRAERGTTYVPLGGAHRYLRDGTNLLTLEAHANPDRLDFCIDPALVIEE
jgi:hypothetical protein